MDGFGKMPSPPGAAPAISTEDARQGEIVLKRRWERIVFIAGLVAAVLVAAAVMLYLR